MTHPTASIFNHFEPLKDPRVDRNKHHQLKDILFMTLCAVICGADNWVAVEFFAKSKQKWFNEILDLPNGIPSHDTFGKVFASLDQQVFSKCFIAWMQDVMTLTHGEVIALDGKSMRATREGGKACSAIHMISAWACNNKLVLGQQVIDKKSNEITALPKLLASLDITGSVITIDAMGCQTHIAEYIVERNADFMISLKGNQGTLHDDVKTFFELSSTNADYETFDAEHGRYEVRKATVLTDIDWLRKRNPKWSMINSVISISTHREVKSSKQTSEETRYFISSLDSVSPQRISDIIRAHWGIENGLHWVLDQAFDQDRLRARNGNSAANMAIMQHTALNLLKQDTTLKTGIKNKRLTCGWNHDYLIHVLNGLAKNKS